MSIWTEYPRLNGVARYAEDHIRASAAQANGHTKYAGPDYRWQHTLRVTQYGLRIARAEGANVELVAAACLLHDSEWFSDREKDERSHGRLAAWVIRSFLEQAGYLPEEVDNIAYSVAVHVDGRAGFDHEHTLEAKVVSDADNVDRFGALRAIYYCIDALDDYQALINKLTKRLKRLEEFRQQQVLETAEGNRLFDQQLSLQMDLYKKLIAEYRLTRLPD